MALLQTIALLCQMHSAGYIHQLSCQQYYVKCVDNKYNNYAKRVHEELRLPTGDFSGTFLKQCIKEKRS